MSTVRITLLALVALNSESENNAYLYCDLKDSIKTTAPSGLYTCTYTLSGCIPISWIPSTEVGLPSGMELPMSEVKIEIFFIRCLRHTKARNSDPTVLVRNVSLLRNPNQL
jgi:hypothetical protein